jgi:hypothetical protein
VVCMVDIKPSRRRKNGLPPIAVVRELSIKCGCDPRTIEDELLAPGELDGVVRRRIRQVLAEIGIGVSPAGEQ